MNTSKFEKLRLEQKPNIAKKADCTSVNPSIAKPIVSGALHSLHEDLKGFQEMRFLTPDAKIGLGIAIEQVERYMRGDLEARQQ